MDRNWSYIFYIQWIMLNSASMLILFASWISERLHQYGKVFFFFSVRIVQVVATVYFESNILYSVKQ